MTDDVPSLRALAFLNHLRKRPQPIEQFEGAMRDGMLEAGTLEPPLCDTDGPLVFLTEAGRRVLADRVR